MPCRVGEPDAPDRSVSEEFVAAVDERPGIERNRFEHPAAKLDAVREPGQGFGPRGPMGEQQFPDPVGEFGAARMFAR